MSADLKSLVERLEKVASRLESASGSSGVVSGSAPVSSGDDDASGNPSVSGYEEIVNGSVKTFVDLSNGIGGEVAQQAGMVNSAFQQQLAFIKMAAESKEPAQTALPELLKGTSTAIQEAVSFRDANRRSNQFNHLSAVSEGLPALGWVTVKPKPCPFIKEMKDAAQFYTNRVLKEFKESDPKQVEWARSFVAIFDELHAYVKRVHTTGLVWNPNGKEAAAPAGPAPSAPKPAPTPAPAKPSSGPADMKSGLFAELSKGTAVTSGLKHVDKSQMTHKNPNLRGGSVVPSATTEKKTTSAPKFGGPAKPKDPVFELQGKKWVVEYQKGNNEIVIEGAINNTVYVYKCENSTIQVKGKVNSITLDGCKKVGVAFDNCVAAFEMINCQSVQMQVLEKVSTISVDKTDGAQIYLSKDSLDAEIVTAKSSEMNVLIPKEDGDFNESPVPEQFKTTVVDGKLVTTPTDIAG